MPLLLLQVECFPPAQASSSSGAVRLLLGTATDGSEQNYLVQAEARVPQPSLEVDPIICETYSGTPLSLLIMRLLRTFVLPSQSCHFCLFCEVYAYTYPYRCNCFYPCMLVAFRMRHSLLRLLRCALCAGRNDLLCFSVLLLLLRPVCRLYRRLYCASQQMHPWWRAPARKPSTFRSEGASRTPWKCFPGAFASS